MSKIIYDDLNVTIKPTEWRIITTLQNIDKRWKVDVYSTIHNFSIIKDNFEVVNVKDLPSNIHPNLEWLIPLSLDLNMHGSIFNQILMK
jgi:hypothetical protein